MDFTLSKEHEMARQLFKDFAEKEVKPLAQEIDEQGNKLIPDVEIPLPNNEKLLVDSKASITAYLDYVGAIEYLAARAGINIPLDGEKDENFIWHC